MNVLVVGNGGREHALAWTLLRSPNDLQVICTPGHGGTATLKGCQNYPIAVDDFEGITRIAQEYNVSLVVVGPEVPLALGITDHLQAHLVRRECIFFSFHMSISDHTGKNQNSS